MKDLLHWTGAVLCMAGMLASLLVAAFPAWFLVKYSEGNKWLKTSFKILCIFGCGGWVFPAMWVTERFGWEEGIIGLLWTVPMGLILMCALRGEAVARMNGEIEDDGRGGVRYVNRK